MLGMLFHVFVYFNAYFACFSLGSAEADIGLDEKLNGTLMASCVRNIYTKYYENLVIFNHVRIKNICDVFETQCRYIQGGPKNCTKLMTP